jgi:hypothetical protein
MDCPCSPCEIPGEVPTELIVPWSNIWTYTKYIHTTQYGLDVVATNNVDNLKMCQVAGVIRSMISCLKNPADRAKFSGHKLVLIGNDDPPHTNGNRNGANINGTFLDVSMINHHTIDEIDGTPFYRKWNIPVHEFAHSIEFKLELEITSDLIYSGEVTGYDPAYDREYFPWSVGRWFNQVSPHSLLTRDVMPAFEHAYMSTVFLDTWFPLPI